MTSGAIVIRKMKNRASSEPNIQCCSWYPDEEYTHYKGPVMK